MTRPIFLISLPRSGSTLLQRMLSVHPDIATCAEPWMLLPLLSMRHPDIGRAAYSHHTAANAINDFLHNVPDGHATFDRAVANFAREFYESAARGAPNFLDKTPRYYLIVSELQRMFPDARFVMLVRHPLAVLASIGATFNKGRFRWFDYWIDWIEGHRCMARAIRHPGQNLYVVRYEDLVTYPGDMLSGLCRWLDIPVQDKMISCFKDVRLAGRMGDKQGSERYEEVSAASLDKWRSFFSSGHRKAAARRMLNRLNPADLQILGYPLEQLRAEIDAIPAATTLDLSGRLDGLINWLAYCVDFRYLQARYRSARKGGKYAYGFYRRH